MGRNKFVALGQVRGGQRAGSYMAILVAPAAGKGSSYGFRPEFAEVVGGAFTTIDEEIVMTRPIACVTGAGSGIGAAIAKELGKRGYHVVVADIDIDAARSVATSLESAQVEPLDVTDPVACDALVNTIVSQHQRLDVWVSNAGISKMQLFVDTPPEDLRRTFEVNVYGVFYGGQAAARAMMSLRTPGCIINTASMAAKQGNVPFLSDYVASKFAVLGLTQAMAHELAPHGIRVNSVCPGFVATPMQTRELTWEAQLRGTKPDLVKQMWIDATPLRRLETPEDVAKVVAFLASDDAAFLTGESISVNGGAYMD
jgi:NAD(P)-dependent dehydrogenase (short-subunit alcohol dehydrogenase family)